ncbi:MAG: hypothetical protein B0D96_09770, partial [Candidatus Sedimenticola endophacoides]
MLLLLWGLLGACQSPPEKGGEGGRPFDIRSLAKSDVDQVTELQLQFAMETLEGLTHKLYMRNPKEWRKAGLGDPEAAVARVFGPGRTGIYPELRGLRTVNAIRLAFEPGYRGDRVLAFAEGVRSMLVAAHNGKQRFYYTQECRYLVKDFGTSQSPKSTRQRDSRYCPDRPALITTPSRTLQQSCSCA